MKKAIFLIVLTFSIIVNAQKKNEELMYMVLENFTYQPNTSKLKFDLVIKNNSDKTLYFIKPKNFFFSNHNDNYLLEEEYQTYSKPYYITITPYKNCASLKKVKDAATSTNDTKEAVEEVVEIEEVEEPVEAVVDAVKDDKLEEEETVIESTETAAEAVSEAKEAVAYNYNKAYKIINQIIEIPAREYRKFKNIEIDRNYGVFCKDENYNITVDYYSSIKPIDYYAKKNYKKHLKNNDTEAINALFENELKVLKKENISNIENLKNILKIYNGLLETNTTKFYSNTIESN